MIYDFSYESSSGDLFEFGSESLWPEDDQFRSMEYSTVSSGHRILGFYRSITKFTVPVAVHTRTARLTLWPNATSSWPSAPSIEGG